MHKLGFIVDMDGTMIDSMGYHAHPLPKVLEMTTGRTCVECMDLLFERPDDCQEALDDVHDKESLYRDLFESEFREVKGFKAFIAHVTERGIPWTVGTAGDKIVWSLRMRSTDSINPTCWRSHALRAMPAVLDRMSRNQKRKVLGKYLTIKSL